MREKLKSSDPSRNFLLIGRLVFFYAAVAARIALCSNA